MSQTSQDRSEVTRQSFDRSRRVHHLLHRSQAVTNLRGESSNDTEKLTGLLSCGRFLGNLGPGLLNEGSKSEIDLVELGNKLVTFRPDTLHGDGKFFRQSPRNNEPS